MPIAMRDPANGLPGRQPVHARAILVRSGSNFSNEVLVTAEADDQQRGDQRRVGER
jgi:hypothetical protein